jgi:hypothetical protein
MKRGVNRRASQNKRSGSGQGNPVDHEIASSHMGGELAKRVTCKQDYIRANLSSILTQSPPKNLQRSIHWFQCQDTRLSAQSISTSVYTEVNFAFSLNDTPFTSAIQALFDQFCIYAVVVNVCHSSISSSNYLGRFTSAIDYDNTTNLGTEFALQAYSTAQTVEVTPGLNVQRLVKPTVDTTIYSSQYGPQRLWIDNGSPSTGHYGFRMFWTGNTSSALLVDVICTYIIGARCSV